MTLLPFRTLKFTTAQAAATGLIIIVVRFLFPGYALWRLGGGYALGIFWFFQFMDNWLLPFSALYAAATKAVELKKSVNIECHGELCTTCNGSGATVVTDGPVTFIPFKPE